MQKNSEIFKMRVADVVARILNNPNSSKAAKSAAGSAFSQARLPANAASLKMAAAAWRVLNQRANKKIKSAAVSALSQRPRTD